MRRWEELHKANEAYKCPRTGKKCVPSGYENYCRDCSRWFDCMPPPVKVPLTEQVSKFGLLRDRLPQSLDDGAGDCG